LIQSRTDFICEQYVESIQHVLGSWSASLCSSAHDTNAIRLHLSESLLGCSLSPSETVPLRATGPLRIERLIFRGQETSGREKFVTEWAEYLASFASIESFELQIYGIRVTGAAPLSVDTDIRFDLVGTAHDGAREQRVGAWHLAWVKEAGARDAGAQDEQQPWAVRKWTSDPEVRSRLTGPGFTEATRHCLASNTVGMAQLLPGIDH
jgi:hypothetical protein